jgi:hypothetical protein
VRVATAAGSAIVTVEPRTLTAPRWRNGQRGRAVGQRQRDGDLSAAQTVDLGVVEEVVESAPRLHLVPE